MKTLPVALALMAGLGLGAWGATGYADNRAELDALRSAIVEAWTAIEPELERRTKLAQKLGSAAPGSSGALTEAVERFDAAGGRSERIDAAEALGRALADTMKAIGEGEQPATEELVRLRNQIADAENALAPARRRYNEAVQEYNTALQLFPSNLTAWLGGLERETAYFRTTEETRLADPPARLAAETESSSEDVQ